MADFDFAIHCTVQCAHAHPVWIYPISKCLCFIFVFISTAPDIQMLWNRKTNPELDSNTLWRSKKKNEIPFDCYKCGKPFVWNNNNWTSFIFRVHSICFRCQFDAIEIVKFRSIWAMYLSTIDEKVAHIDNKHI